LVRYLNVHTTWQQAKLCYYNYDYKFKLGVTRKHHCASYCNEEKTMILLSGYGCVNFKGTKHRKVGLTFGRSMREYSNGHIGRFEASVNFEALDNLNTLSQA